MRIKFPGFLLTKAQIACIFSGFLLYGILELAGQGTGDASVLVRADPGQGETSYDLIAVSIDGTDYQKEIPIQVSVKERQYTSEEADVIIDQLLMELTTAILGDNESLQTVRTDLNLITKLADYGMKIQWESEDTELIDAFGSVHNEEIPDEGKTTYLRAETKIGNFTRQYDIKVTVLPPLLTEEEQTLKDIQTWVQELDKEQQTQAQLKLPNQYKGGTIRWYMENTADYKILPFIGILAAILLKLKEHEDKLQAVKQREQLLLLDYSEVVSKLMVFIGAGMALRIAWENIADGYETSVNEGRRSFRPAYDEMVKTTAQLRSGTPEHKAYSEFGKRCGLQPYVKLAALLEQNRRTGSKQLRPVLELELVSAFDQRKNLAKIQGEEAGTKLLLPLFLMLGIVMVMVVVPAFLAFY